MDNVTHALAGGLLAAASIVLVERRTRRPVSTGFRRAAATLGVVAAELPDADLLYAGPMMGMGKLGYLLHHRGHTHTVLFAVAAALLAWGAVLLARRRSRDPVERRALLSVALVGTLSHLALDFTNSYGVHPFWPVNDAWFYGDAVFIIEPWLWIVALPALWVVFRGRVSRTLFALALVAILAASWTLGQVARDVAIALTIGAVAWSAVVLRSPPARAVLVGAVAWAAVEATFFAAERVARDAVRTAVGDRTYRDAVLNPAVGDPRCVRALVVELDGDVYRATSAVAPFPALRDAAACGAPRDGMDVGMVPSARPSTEAVRWGASWSASAAELAQLARTNCEVDAALRFVRVPAWQRLPGGGVQLWDMRYGRGGFAEVVSDERPARCPTNVPPWTPPRLDLLGAR